MKHPLLECLVNDFVDHRIRGNVCITTWAEDLVLG